MSQPPHKQSQPLMRRAPRQGFMLGIQHCPTLVESSGTRSVTLPTAHGSGIVWKVLLSNNYQHGLREETVMMTVYSTLMACPRCSCQMQLGCQFKIERTRAGTTVSLKRLDIVRVPVSSWLLRHIQARAGGHYVCEPLTFYILVKVQIGDTCPVSREAYWKVTI